MSLRFPAVRPNPETALQNVLRSYNIENFGQFLYWPATIRVGQFGKWSRRSFSAKIDTGASISLLPGEIKEELKIAGGIPYSLYGVVRTERCKVDVELVRIDLQLLDESGNELVFDDVWVALSKSERIPSLLGVKGVLENCVLTQKAEDTDLLIT